MPNTNNTRIENSHQHTRTRTSTHTHTHTHIYNSVYLTKIMVYDLW